jgi:hydroxymethylpyrimidine/phosphomethylpyrimidine kinase
MTPTTLTIAGSDSGGAGSDGGGGAGIQVDLVTALMEVPDDIVAAQMDAVLDDIEVHAVKVGMLLTAGVTRAVASRLRKRGVPVVPGPVMVGRSGDSLLREEAEAALVEEMLPRAGLVTPNLPEAARPQGEAQARNEAEMLDQTRRLMRLRARAVPMKDGHGSGGTVTDLLVAGDAEPMRLEAPRHRTSDTHGKGYSLSSAAEPARGRTLEDAVGAAPGWLQQATGAADDLRVGSGHGPVHRFQARWPRSA